jgi:MFS family permease
MQAHEVSTDTSRSQLPFSQLPFSQLLKLSVYWLGILAVWGGLFGVVLPVHLTEIDEDSAGMLTLGIVVCSVIVGIAVLPVVGRISDYTVSRWGKRKPYIVIGTCLDVLILFGIAAAGWFSSGVTLYLSLVGLIALLAFTSNLAQGPFQGYVPAWFRPGKLARECAGRAFL